MQKLLHRRLPLEHNAFQRPPATLRRPLAAFIQSKDCYVIDTIKQCVSPYPAHYFLRYCEKKRHTRTMALVGFLPRSVDFQWRSLRDVTVVIFNFLKFA